jgi:hypothetical protein
MTRPPWLAGDRTVRYFANYGPANGVVKYLDVPSSIGVHDSLIGSKLIGEAHGTGWTSDGNGTAIWRLVIGGTEIPGRWFIRDREFILAK